MQDKARGSQAPLRTGNTAPQSGSGTFGRGSFFTPWGQFGGLLSQKARRCPFFAGSRWGYIRISGGASCQEKKFKFALRVSPETQQLVKEMCLRDNCCTQNEFIEKAIRFYAGYISGQEATAYLPPALASVLRGTVQDTENRICRLLFKLAVEQDMVMNVLAAGMELPNEQFHAMRGRCVQDVKKPAAVSRWVTLSAIRGAVCDHPHPVQILRCKTKNKSPRKK